jgi:hypothetical protein
MTESRGQEGGFVLSLQEALSSCLESGCHFFVCGFLQYLQPNGDAVPQIRHDSLLPYPFNSLFIILLRIRCYMSY